MNNEQQPNTQPNVQLNTGVPKDAIEIIATLLQPGTQLDRRLSRIADECIDTIKNALNKPAQE